MQLQLQNKIEETSSWLGLVSASTIMVLMANDVKAEPSEEPSEEPSGEPDSPPASEICTGNEGNGCFKSDAVTMGVVTGGTILALAISLMFIPKTLKMNAIEKVKEGGPAFTLGVALSFGIGFLVFVATVLGTHGYLPNDFGIIFGALLVVVGIFVGVAWSKAK